MGPENQDLRAQVKEFLTSRRARIGPDQAGLPAYGGNRRVPGLRREEVAMLAGVSVDYYVRLERGNLSGASDSVLDALAATLQLDEAERLHLFDLARPTGADRRDRSPSALSAQSAQSAQSATISASVRQVLDSVSDAPAWVRNGRHDILATNLLGRALYTPVFESPHQDPPRPANTTRFAYLDPAAETFWRDYERITHDAASMLRMEAGRNPHDPELIRLVGELSTRSALFRRRWASRDVKLHRSGRKRLHHPVVGDLDLDYESMDLPSSPGLVLNVYTAPPDTPTADALRMLASWAASHREQLSDVEDRDQAGTR